MKKYILFMWEMYEHGGGMNDIFGSFDTVEDAVKQTQVKLPNWMGAIEFQIVDRDTWEIVQEEEK